MMEVNKWWLSHEIDKPLSVATIDMLYYITLRQLNCHSFNTRELTRYEIRTQLRIQCNPQMCGKTYFVTFLPVPSVS